MAFPDASSELTHILVVKDSAESKGFYVDKLGAVPFADYGSSIVVKFLGSWLLLVEPGGPTEDKPNTDFVAPENIETVTNSFTIRVTDCLKTYLELKDRGVEFVTEPVHHEHEVRAFFTDLDSHLFEISQYIP